MSERIFKITIDSFEKTRDRAYEEMKVAFHEIYPEEYFIRGMFYEIVSRFIFENFLLMKNGYQTTFNYLGEIKFLIETGEFKHLRKKKTVGDNILLENFETQFAHSFFAKYKCNELVSLALTIYYIFNIYEQATKDKNYISKVEQALEEVILTRKQKEQTADKIGDNGTIIDVKNEIPLAVRIKQFFDENGMKGQENAKKIVAMSVQNFVYSNGDIREPILLEGPTGSGKTLLFELLQQFPELDNVVFLSYCASDLTPNGFSGDNVQDLFSKFEREMHAKKFKNWNTKTQPSETLGVIFLDEIDNVIGNSCTDSNGEDCNAMVTM